MLVERQDVLPGSWFVQAQNSILHMAVNSASFHMEYPGNPKMPLSVSVKPPSSLLGKIPLGVIQAIPKSELVETVDVEIFEEDVSTMGRANPGDVVLHDWFKEAIVVTNQSLRGMSSAICIRTSDGNVVVSGFGYNVLRTRVEAKIK